MVFIVLRLNDAERNILDISAKLLPVGHVDHSALLQLLKESFLFQSRKNGLNVIFVDYILDILYQLSKEVFSESGST